MRARRGYSDAMNRVDTKHYPTKKTGHDPFPHCIIGFFRRGTTRFYIALSGSSDGARPVSTGLYLYSLNKISEILS